MRSRAADAAIALAFAAGGAHDPAADISGDGRVTSLDALIKDILMAGTCIYFGLPLLTRNIKHFHRIKELSLVYADAVL